VNKCKYFYVFLKFSVLILYSNRYLSSIAGNLPFIDD
jgi:hypothetical protein